MKSEKKLAPVINRNEVLSITILYNGTLLHHNLKYFQ